MIQDINMREHKEKVDVAVKVLLLTSVLLIIAVVVCLINLFIIGWYLALVIVTVVLIALSEFSFITAAILTLIRNKLED